MNSKREKGGIWKRSTHNAPPMCLPNIYLLKESSDFFGLFAKVVENGSVSHCDNFDI